MDNLTHSLLGAALARTRLGRASPYATPALVIGANLPDLDLVVRLWGGRAGYLVHHRGVTHGVLGAALCAVLLALALRGFERWRGHWDEGSWAGAAAIAAAALASHPLLDLLNVYGLRPWLPFDASWYYGDAVFIVEPWLWLALGLPALIGSARTRAGDVAWTALFALGMTLVLVAASRGRAPLPLAIAWSATTVVLVGARLSGLGSRVTRGPLRIGLGAALLYVGAQFMLGPLAASRARSALAEVLAAEGPLVAVTHAPQPLDPLAWRVLFETERAVLVQPLHLVDGPGTLLRLEKHAHDPRVAAATASDCAAAWRSFVRHPHAHLQPGPGGVRVELMDARFQYAPSPRGEWSPTVVHVGPDGAHCEPTR